MVKHFSRGERLNYVPLHELEREVLKMPSGNIVKNPDCRQSVATVDIKHDLSVKWYGAQFHVSNHRLIVNWLNEIAAIDCKISRFNDISSGAMFFILAAVRNEK